MTATRVRELRANFAAASHLLGLARLRPLADGEAVLLGARCAMIDPYRRLGQSAAALTGYLTREDPALFRFAIETKDGLAGVVAVRTPWLRGPFLEMLAVLPEAQGAGVGRQVVDWVAGQAGLIAANLWSTVSDFNETARAFYRRVGFAEVSVLPGLIAEDAAEILLRRALR